MYSVENHHNRINFQLSLKSTNNKYIQRNSFAVKTGLNRVGKKLV